MGLYAEGGKFFCGSAPEERGVGPLLQASQKNSRTGNLTR
jgi:hypothetical protein